MKSKNIIAVLLMLSVVSNSSGTEELPTEYLEYASRSKTATTSSMSNCPQTSYIFPNGPQTRDYLRVKTPIPDLNEFTICFFLTRYSKSDYDAPISYANSQHPNAILMEIGKDSVGIYIRGEKLVEQLLLDLHKEYHICIASFTSTTGASYIFVNGNLAQILYHTPADIIKGDGVLIIGQDQDSTGGGFDSKQSLQGRISNLMMWNRVLDFDDFTKMYMNRCRCPAGSIVSLELKNVVTFGGVAASITQQC